jgi:hypothetical protein
MVAGSSFATIEAGVLRLPANGVELCDTATAQVGLVKSIAPSTEGQWAVDQGAIRVPLAQCDTEGGADTVAGVLTGAEWCDDPGRSQPFIWQGVLKIPVPDVSNQLLTHCKVENSTADAGWVNGATLRLYLADYDSSAGRQQAGLLSSVTEISGGTPRIEDGVLILPRYSFNEEQFDVQEDGRVSLLHTPLEGLYDAENNQRLTWAEIQDGSNVRLSYSSSTTLGVSVKMFGNFLSIYVDRP